MTKNKDAWSGKEYHKHSSTQHQGGLAALADYPFRGNEWVLDVGCGTGKTAAVIAAKVAHGRVIGIDASHSMIHEAQRTYGTVKNLTFMLQDAATFHFEEKFDLIVSFFAVHWMKDQLAVFKHMHAALKPTGKIILRMSGGNQPEINQVFTGEPWASRIKAQTWQGKTTEEYAALIKVAGFKNIDACTEWHAQMFASKQALLDHLMTWMPHATGLPDDQALECAQSLAQRVMKAQKSAEGSIELRSPMAIIEATV